jgi:hypothetical protein
MFLSTSSSAATATASGSASETATQSGSGSEDGSDSSDIAVQAAAVTATRTPVLRPSPAASGKLAAPPKEVQAATAAQQVAPDAQQQQAAKQLTIDPGAKAGGGLSPALFHDGKSSAAPQQLAVPQISSSVSGSSVASSSISSHAAAVLPSGAADAVLPSAAGARPVAPVREIGSPSSSLSALVHVFDRQRLSEETELMDARGLRLREGSTIIFTAHPSGTMMVQGKGTARWQVHR